MKHNIRLIALYYEGDNTGSSIQLDTVVQGVSHEYNWTIYPGHVISPNVEIYEAEASGLDEKAIAITLETSSPNDPIVVTHPDSFTLGTTKGVKTISLNVLTEGVPALTGTVHLTFAYWKGEPEPRNYYNEFVSISRCICSIALLQEILTDEGNPSQLSLYYSLNGDTLQDLFSAANALGEHLNYGEERVFHSGATPCVNTGALEVLIRYISENQGRITNSTLKATFDLAFNTYKNLLEQLKTLLNSSNLNPCGESDEQPWEGLGELGEDFTDTASCICKIFTHYATLSPTEQDMADLLETALTNYFTQLQTFLAGQGITFNASEIYPCAKVYDISRMLGIIAANFNNWDAKPGDYEELKYPLRHIKSLFAEITFTAPTICDENYTGPTIDFNNAVLQSAYIYLQACGSDNTNDVAGIIEGIHLRWALLKELGENHLPKGDLANSTSAYNSNIAYNKEDDFVKIYKTPYVDPIVIELDFNTDVPQNVNTSTGRVWEVFKTTSTSLGTYTNTVIIRFTDETLYDAITHDPVSDTFDFIKAYSGVLEIEVENKLMFAGEFEIQKDVANPAVFDFETIRITDTTDINSLQITNRTTLTGDPVTRRQVGENIKFFRVKYQDGFPALIKLETYDDFLLSRNSWTAVGDFGLTLTDATAIERLDCNSPNSINNSWPRFNNGLKTNLSNYEDKWDAQYGIKYGVTEYLDNSVSDTKATVILDSQDAGDTSKIEISYLDYLNIAALDYHVARMLGLGHIDIFDNQANKYVYIAVYRTAPEMLNNPDFQATDMRDHIYMSLPTDKLDYRLPKQPKISDVTYGFDDMDEEVEKTILNETIHGKGYGKFDKVRYINIYRNRYDYEISYEGFFDNSVPFDISEIPTAVLYGFEYKEFEELVYRLPEISSDGEFKDFGPSGISEEINETIPAPDTGGKLFTHEETEEGVHNYAIYGINWFYRVSEVSDETATNETLFTDYLLLKPPHNINGHYIQKEENLLFTTTAEQTELAQRESANPGADNSFTRLTFEWNHTQRIAYQTANKLEFYFRDSLPNIVQGQIDSTVSVSGGSFINIHTKPYTVISQDTPLSVSPAIASGDFPKYIGSWFVTEKDRFIIVDITSGTNGPVFKVKPILEPAKIDDPQGTGRYRGVPKKITPAAGLRFQVVENLADDNNWTRLDKTITLVSHSSHTEIEVVNGENVTQHIGGVMGTATIISDPEQSPVNGLYKITFDTETLADHPQKNTEKVTWYKGTARITNGTEKKVLEVWAIESQNPLIIWAYDPDYGNNPITTGTGVDVNFHPGYKVYLDKETSNNFDKNHLLPATGFTKKESLLAVRAIDDTLNPDGKSNIAIPATLIGINKREPVKPQKPVGPAFATRPDTFGKSSYTFDINITAGDPFSLAFYRASDFEILATIYEPEDLVQIYDDIEALETNEFNFERFSDLANVVFDDNTNHLGEFKEYDGYRLPNTFKTEVLGGATTVEEITAVLKLVINNAFTPLTEQPVVYGFAKQASGIIQTLNMPPVIRDGKGHLLNANDAPFNPYPNAVRFTESGVDKIRFTDYSLDGAARGIYFYFAREISREMVIGQRSDVLGPIRLVNSFPADAPYIRKVETVLADPYLPSEAGVRFYINPYHPDENVKKVAIYRTTDIDQTLSIQQMQFVTEVFMTNYAEGFMDIFDDLDYPLFGETIYYRLVALREILNEQDEVEFIPSLPSKVVEGRVVDNINPPAPEISYTIDNFSSPPPKIKDIELVWEPTTYNAKYYLYKMTSSGNWQKVYEVASNQPMTYTVTELDTVDDDGDTIYHRYKVDVENANGLLNLDEKPIVISGPVWPQNGLKMMLWDGSPSSYPGTGSVIIDLSGNGNNGDLVNFATTGTSTSGYHNGIINYDGVNDYINFPNAWLSGKTEFSFHTVFKMVSPPNSYGIYDNGILGPNGGGSYIVGTRLYGFGTFYSPRVFLNGSLTNFSAQTHNGNVSNFIISDISKYYHYTVTIQPNACKIYINGILCHSEAINIGTLSSIPSRIGRYGSVQLWEGQIPVFMGYDKALSQQEVQQIFNYFKDKYPSI